MLIEIHRHSGSLCFKMNISPRSHGGHGEVSFYMAGRCPPRKRSSVLSKKKEISVVGCLKGERILFLRGFVIPSPSPDGIIINPPLCSLCLRGEPVFYNSRSTSCISCQGSPWMFSCSMKGSGSNSSTLNTPGFFHRPVMNIMAPIIAGTPVV